MAETSYLDLLNIDRKKHRTIAVVGGGGKTSLIYRLAEELVNLGEKVIITTTTHMAFETQKPFALNGDSSLVKEALRSYGYVIAAKYEEETGKIKALSYEQLAHLRSFGAILLMEADGAKHLPVKVPNDWEPVIPHFVNLVIGVIGLDCLGRPISEKSHRPEKMAAFLKKNPSDSLEASDLVKIATSGEGLRKEVRTRDYRVYFNKADVLANLSPARQLVNELKDYGVEASYRSLKETALQ